MLPRYNKTFFARCDWGPWVMYTLEGKWHHGFDLGAIFPLRCTKRHGPRHSVQQLYNVNENWGLNVHMYIHRRFVKNL